MNIIATWTTVVYVVMHIQLENIAHIYSIYYWHFMLSWYHTHCCIIYECNTRVGCMQCTMTSWKIVNNTINHLTIFVKLKSTHVFEATFKILPLNPTLYRQRKAYFVVTRHCGNIFSICRSTMNIIGTRIIAKIYFCITELVITDENRKFDYFLSCLFPFCSSKSWWIQWMDTITLTEETPTSCRGHSDRTLHNDELLTYPPPTPGQNGQHVADDRLKCMFLNGNVWISINFIFTLFLRVQSTISQHWFW